MKGLRTIGCWIGALSVLLAACNTLEVQIESHAAPASTPSPEARATPSAATTAEPAGTVAPPQGLVFETAEGAWITDASGEAALLIQGTDVQISPDGTQALYTDGDLWLADLAGGERRNLTNMPDHVVCCARWWPARQGTVVFGALPRERAPQPGWTGFLAAVGTDGGDRRVLDDQHQIAGAPAPSPDGKTIAYGGGRTGWLYHGEDGTVTPFDPLDYGLADVLPETAQSAQIGSLA
jgi:hypothetical protein